MTVLLMRTEKGLAAIQVPDFADALEMACLYVELDPENATREWCVIQATETRVARWPDPEPWATPS